MKYPKGFVTLIFILLIVILLGLLGGYFLHKDTTAPKVADKNPSSTIVSPSILGYITSDQVGPFRIEGSVPDETSLSQAGYSIKETTIFPEGMPTKQFIVSKDGKDLLNFILYSDPSKIWDIKVTSPEFKTKEGIGVGSTISDFIKAYPNYQFWYSQEEGESFVLNTSNSKASPQFLLDRNGLLYPNKSFSPVRATISDFKTSAKIASVRVYFSP